jgi:hypothetical protein
VSRLHSIEGARLLDFIRTADTAVVLVSVHRVHAFNPSLARRLAAAQPDIELGVVSVFDLLATGRAAVPFLVAGLKAHEAPMSFGVLPGYYLFSRGQMLAWDAGLPTMADGEPIAGSLLLGTIWSGVTRDFSFITQALRLAADETGAQRVATRFSDLLGRRRTAHEHARRYQSGPNGDVKWACKILNVQPDAGEREIQKAWRRCRIAHHPDRARDQSDFERRSRLSVDINHARDILLKRGHGVR